MSIYQRCLSKIFIFFSILLIIFLFFIESSIGFASIFNFTSRFFIGLKVEEISGNWHNFTLKNVKYNISGISMTANSIHVILDTASLFEKSTIFKEIATKNLIITWKKNASSHFSKKNASSHFSKINIFVKYPIIFKKIHIDKIFFQSSKIRILFLNIFSSVKLINNNIVISPTCISAINLESLKSNFKKQNILHELHFIKKFSYIGKKDSFLYFFSQKPKIFFPFNINLISFKCNRIQLMDYKNNNLFAIELRAKLEDNILQAKKIKIDSYFFKINSYGTVFLNQDNSVACSIINRIVIPRLHNRIMNFSLKANLNPNNKFIFKVTSKDLYKIKFYGQVFLNRTNYPFLIKLKSHKVLFSIKKKYIFKINSFNAILKGKINNYSLSLKNTLTLQGLPPIFIDVKGRGNFQNIFLKTIKCFSIKKKKIYRDLFFVKDSMKYNQYILELMGKINVSGIPNNNTYNLDFSKMNLDGNFMKKKFSILGSIFYKNFNFIEVPMINLFLGKNKVHLNGWFKEKKYHIYSAINANNLEYFLPELKGKIKAKINLVSDDRLPIINSKIVARNLKWNNINCKNIKALALINSHHVFSEKILVNIIKMHIDNFNIDTLRIQTNTNNDKQKFSIMLKTYGLYLHLIINGHFNKETGHWNGFFKKIKIQNFLAKVTSEKNNSINIYNYNKISNFYQKNIKIQDVLSSFLHNIKMSVFNVFNQSIINFQSELSIIAQLKLTLGERITNGKVFLTSHNIKLEKKLNEKNVIEKIDFFKTSINLIKNNFKSKWIVKKLNNQKVTGYLNITDIYDKKNIKGKFIFNSFPLSSINFFTTNFEQVHGILKSNIKIFGTLYQPKVLADVNFQNVFIKSNKILKYITVFFPYFLDKIDVIKINQEITMKKGNIFFKLKPLCQNSTDIEWTVLFKSNKISVLILPKIKIKFSSQLDLHYLLEKYDLIGYIKFFLFYFKINEKNFIF